MSGFTRSPIAPKKWKVITSAYTAKAGDLLILNVSTPVPITLPSNPKEGDEIWMIQANTAFVAIPINFSGKKFKSATPSSINYNDLRMDGLIYVNNSIGWICANGYIF
jgi:hypothetical protein